MAAPIKKQRRLDAFFRSCPKADHTDKPPCDDTECQEKDKAATTCSETLVNLSVPDEDDKAPCTSPESSMPEKDKAAPSCSEAPVTSTPSKDPIWTSDQAVNMIQEMWPDNTVHNYFWCRKSGCCCLTKEERDRLCVIHDAKKMEKKKPDKFQHEWMMKPNYWSACYVEGLGFFCILCRKHNMKHLQNKSQVFIESPSIRLKEETLSKHMATELHISAADTDVTQRFSVFHKIRTEKEEVATTVLQSVFSTAYFLMKETIANRKLLPFIDFMQKTLGKTELKHFEHRSEGSLREIYLAVGGAVKQSVLDKAKKAKSFGLMTDEVTDISVSSQLVTFIQFWDSEEHAVATAFLSSQNVLEYFDSCNAEAITQLILSQLEESGLDVAKLMGLSTDGASVMVGKSNGVATKLRERNTKLLNIHCVCHRLALACTDTNSELKYIKQIEEVLKQLWYFFHNSPKKMACFLKCQLALQKVHLSGEKEQTEKILARRLQKACQTRWLSFGASVKAALRDFEAILLTLQQIDDAAGIGLLKKMKSVKFLGALYILDSILPVLSTLSQQFQAGKFHFSMVKPAVSRGVAALANIKEQREPLVKLQSDMESYTNISEELQLTKTTGKELDNILEKYVDALTTNIQDRLGHAPSVIEAYCIFDPLSAPSANDSSFEDYGKAQIDILAEHFFPNNEEKKKKLHCQFSQMKYFLNAKTVAIPTGCQSSTFFMSYMLKNHGIFNPCLFEEMLYVVEVGLSLPCSNAWPERGASTVKITKSKFRSRLGNDMLNALMQVSINGPESEESSTTVGNAVKSWLHAKPRRKMKMKLKIEETDDDVSATDAGSNAQLVSSEEQDDSAETELVAKLIGLDCQNADLQEPSDSDDEY